MRFFIFLSTILLITPFFGFSEVCSPKMNGFNTVMYHRFDGKKPSTSVDAKMLEAHMKFFKDNGFQFWSTEKAIKHLKSNKSFPDKVLVVTVDDAYKSTYSVAHAIFTKYQVPYTVFVNTEGIDRKFQAYMSWDEMRELAKSDLVSFEAHGHTHAHMIRTMNAEQRKKDVLTSVYRIYEELKIVPKYFAYPYGETTVGFTEALRNYSWTIKGKKHKFEAAFSTQSGPAGCSSNLFHLPRFALNMRYGKMGPSFKNKMLSRHFPVMSFSPSKTSYCSGEAKDFSFVVHSELPVKGRINCFTTSTKNDFAVKQGNKVEISLKESFKFKGGQDTRDRINCTRSAGQGRFYWFGKEFAIKKCVAKQQI